MGSSIEMEEFSREGRAYMAYSKETAQHAYITF